MCVGAPEHRHTQVAVFCFPSFSVYPRPSILSVDCANVDGSRCRSTTVACNFTNTKYILPGTREIGFYCGNRTEQQRFLQRHIERPPVWHQQQQHQAWLLPALPGTTTTTATTTFMLASKTFASFSSVH